MTSHENTLKQALMGLSKLQLPLEDDLSEKEIKEIQQAENAEKKINNLTAKQKSEIGDFRLSIIQSAMEDHPDLTVETALEMMEFFGA